MEHNFEKTIREKINSVEQQSVHWEKDMVWSKIERGDSRKSIVHYYAAASVILAGALIFFTIGLNHRNEINFRLRSIELSIEQSKLYQANHLSEKIAATSADCDKEKIGTMNQKVSIASAQGKKTNVSVLAAQIPEITQDIVVTETKEQPIIITEVKPAEVAPIVRSVQVIIGGGIIETSSARERKFRFKLLPSEESESANPSSESLTARSKFNND
jgi:hypothetical protein